MNVNAEAMKRFFREARAAMAVHHPNVVRVFDANVTKTARGSCGFFTMEYAVAKPSPR